MTKLNMIYIINNYLINQDITLYIQHFKMHNISSIDNPEHSKMDYDTWENELNNMGAFAPLNLLQKHLNSAPTPTNKDEAATIDLAQMVLAVRAGGGDITQMQSVTRS